MANDKTEDSKNREILSYVFAHPDATVEQIGRFVGLKREATQKRVTKLYKTGNLKRVLGVDLEALGFPNRFRIDVNISPSVLRKENKEIRRIRKSAQKLGIKIANDQILLALQLMGLTSKDFIVEEVAVLLGDPADLTMIVRARNLRDMMDFVTARVRPIHGITETATCFESWNVYRDPGAIKYIDFQRRLIVQKEEAKQDKGKQTTKRKVRQHPQGQPQ